jgi:predicted ester cyclase
MVAATMMGKHTGPFNGIEATGRRINHKQVHIFTVADGQVVHHRAVRDDLGLLLQLGWHPSG